MNALRLSLGDIGDSLPRSVLHVLGDALGARPRLHAVGRGAGLRVEAADAARHGRPPPAAVARASGFGMVSSSCSYAATAMAKSLFQKGADFTTAMIFMFASTNLVVELGDRAARADGLAVRARRVHRRPDHDRRARARRRLRVLAEARARGARPARRRAAADGRCSARARHDDDDDDAASITSRGRLERRGRVHDVRHQDAAARARHRLSRRRLPHRARADGVVERRVPPRPRLLDDARERPDRSVHRGDQLRVLDRQRADGGRAVARRHRVRRRRQLHLRRPHHDPVAADLPEVLRHRAHAADLRDVLGADVDRRASRSRASSRCSARSRPIGPRRSCPTASSGTTRPS